MHVKTLCLGALSFQEGTGYDIKKLFESAFSHFQNASYGSIYPSLKKLQEEGMVTCHIEPGDKHPDRKLFRITETGTQHLLQTLTQTPPTELVRSDFLVQIFFAHLLPTPVLQQKLDEMEQAYQDELKYLESIQDDPCMTAGMRYAVLQGIRVYQAKLAHLRSERSTLLSQHQHIDSASSADCKD